MSKPNPNHKLSTNNSSGNESCPISSSTHQENMNVLPQQQQQQWNAYLQNFGSLDQNQNLNLNQTLPLNMNNLMLLHPGYMNLLNFGLVDPNTIAAQNPFTGLANLGQVACNSIPPSNSNIQAQIEPVRSGKLTNISQEENQASDSESSQSRGREGTNDSVEESNKETSQYINSVVSGSDSKTELSKKLWSKCEEVVLQGVITDCNLAYGTQVTWKLIQEFYFKAITSYCTKNGISPKPNRTACALKKHYRDMYRRCSKKIIPRNFWFKVYHKLWLSKEFNADGKLVEYPELPEPLV